MPTLDARVIDGLKEKLLSPERMTQMLEALVERIAARDSAVIERRRTLQAEGDEIRQKLTRLYQAIEDGVVEADAEVKERIANLKARREVVEASLTRIQEQATTRTAITPDRVQAFTDLVRSKLDTGDQHARQSYLRTIINRIEVDDHTVRVIGNKATLADAIAGRQTDAGNVRGFVRKWRARQDSNLWPQD